MGYNTAIPEPPPRRSDIPERSYHVAPERLHHMRARDGKVTVVPGRDEDVPGVRVKAVLVPARDDAPDLAVKAASTWTDSCIDHGYAECPDCQNTGIKVGPMGYTMCTRFITCWSDTLV